MLYVNVLQDIDNLNAGEKEVESKALTQKAVEATQATDEEDDCSAKKIFLDKTRVHIAYSNAENPVAASGGNPITYENPKSIHSKGTGGYEVESAVIGNKEEDIVENSANEHLVFKRGITDDCDTLNSTPSSPVMPIIGNCVEEKNVQRLLA